jgi:ArsR family transcriptional regulator
LPVTDAELTKIARALSDPTRLAILRVLAEGRSEACCSPRDDCCPQGICVCDIQARLGLIQSGVSYHLRELKDAGLVSETRSGKWNYYTVDADRLDTFSDAVRIPSQPAVGAIAGRPARGARRQPTPAPEAAADGLCGHAPCSHPT